MREKAIPVSEPSFPGGMIQASAAGGDVPILSDGCQRGLASRSKSLAQMNKSRYRQGVETTKNQSELMRMLAVAKCRLMGYPAVKILVPQSGFLTLPTSHDPVAVRCDG